MVDPAPSLPAPLPKSQRLWALLGWILLIVGIPIFLLPIPLGAALVIAAATILARNSPTGRALLRRAYRCLPLAVRRRLQRFTPAPANAYDTGTPRAES